VGWALRLYRVRPILWRKVMDMNRSSSPALAYSERGTKFFLRGRYDEAESAFREALRHDRRLTEAHNGLGNTLVFLNRYGEAERAFREAVRCDASFTAGRIGLGGVLVLLGQYGNAEGAYLEALRYDPQSLAGNVNLGHLYWKILGKVRKAEKALHKAARCDPGSLAVHSNLGSLRICEGDMGAARSSFKRAAQASAPSVDPFVEFMLGALGRENGAGGHFRAALEVLDNPGSAMIQAGAALVRPSFGRAETKALILLGLDRAAEARAALSGAIALRSGEDVFQGQLYEALAGTRRFAGLDQLREVWRGIIAGDPAAEGPWGGP
jgi:tetratricopeptide (TPR) repeat protein